MFNKKGGIQVDKVIITIGRQYGSGGRMIGELLAKKLGIPFYDKELISIAAKKSGFDEELFKNADEKPTSSLLFSLAMGTYSVENEFTGFVDIPLNDRLFLIQADIIKDIAKQGSCVIVGRCADYILKDRENCINIFIHASLQDRVERAINEYNIPSQKAENIVLKTDKGRASYYSYYANAKWGKVENYSLCINSSSIGIENSAEIIKNFVNMKRI
jgi:cytidylate kinase